MDQLCQRLGGGECGVVLLCRQGVLSQCQRHPPWTGIVKDIHPGQELLMYYGNAYAEILGITYRLDKTIEEEKNPEKEIMSWIRAREH